MPFISESFKDQGACSSQPAAYGTFQTKRIWVLESQAETQGRVPEAQNVDLLCESVHLLAPGLSPMEI